MARRHRMVAGSFGVAPLASVERGMCRDVIVQDDDRQPSVVYWPGAGFTKREALVRIEMAICENAAEIGGEQGVGGNVGRWTCSC